MLKFAIAVIAVVLCHAEAVGQDVEVQCHTEASGGKINHYYLEFSLENQGYVMPKDSNKCLTMRVSFLQNINSLVIAVNDPTKVLLVNHVAMDVNTSYRTNWVKLNPSIFERLSDLPVRLSALRNAGLYLTPDDKFFISATHFPLPSNAITEFRKLERGIGISITYRLIDRAGLVSIADIGKGRKGDFDNDGDVDFADFLKFAEQFGKPQ